MQDTAYAVVSTGSVIVPNTGGKLLQFVYPKASKREAERSVARMLASGGSSKTKTIVPMSEIVPSETVIVLNGHLNGNAPR